MASGLQSKSAVDIPVEDFLLKQPACNLVKLPDMSRGYVTNHCTELLDLSLSTDDDELAKRAFLVLSTASQKVVGALISEDVFFVKATEILSGKQISPLIISRLSSLFDNLLAKLKSGYIEAIGFLAQLLKYIEYPSVFSLFTSILDANSKTKEIQEIMAQIRFENMILNEFGSNASNEKVTNLCSLIRLCLKHPLLRNNFVCDRVMNKLVSLLDTQNPDILNPLWQALSTLCCEINGTKMSQVSDLALKLLKIGDSQLHMYHVCACDFLGKMMYYNPSGFNQRCRTEMVDVCLEIMDKFPESTNMMASVFRLLRNGVKSGGFLSLALNKVIPILIGYAQSAIRNARSANAMSFMADVEASRAGNKMVNKKLENDRRFCSFRDRELKYHTDKLGREYGGPITRYVDLKKSKSCGDDIRNEKRKVAVD